MNPFQATEKYGDANRLIDESIRTQLPHDCFAFPGLFNSHDHLEFNLFPPLANRIYADYKEWGEDIHLNNKDTIQSILQIPIEQRILFGVLKNLVNGITRLVHHGQNHDAIHALTNYPVWTKYQYIHALGTDKHWKMKLNLFFGRDIMIHVGEGTSASVNNEIDELLKWNFFKKKIFGIHTIGLTREQASGFKAIVWCPASNLFLYGKTMQVEKVKDNTHVLFGTDSCVSAPANLWEQLRQARALKITSDEDIFRMLTFNAYKYFYGQELLGKDWVIAKSTSAPDWDVFYKLNPEDILMVIINDTVWLCDDSLQESLRPKDCVPIQVGKAIKWVKRHLGEVVGLVEQQHVALPLDIQSVH